MNTDPFFTFITVSAGRTARLVFFVAAFFSIPESTSAEPTARDSKPGFLVSAFNLGTVDQLPPTAETVTEGLNGTQWCTAAVQGARGEWNQVPTGVDSARWLSVVALGFGRQAHAYVFQFNRPDGGARLMAHYAHRKRLSNGAERWFQPTPQLLGVLEERFSREGGGGGIPLQLEIVEAPAASTADPAGFEEALQLPAHVVLPPVKAIVIAAACSEGWAPTAKTASAHAKLEVRVHDQACSFQLGIERDGKRSVFTKERVPWEEFHDQLCVLFRMPSLSPRVTDFIRPNPDGVQVLESEGDRSFLSVDGELVALDADGREAWRLRSIKGKAAGGVKPKKPDSFAARRDESGKLRLFGWGAGLGEISAKDGSVSMLAPEAPAGASPLFDAGAGGEVVVARAGRLSLFEGGKERWTLAEPAAVSCGPRMDGDRVLFGNEQGDLVAVSRSGGKTLWRVDTGGPLRGPIGAARGLRFVFSNLEEAVLAVDPRDGSVRWRFSAGDVPVCAPFEQGGSIVLATKNNRLLRLNPESGALEAEVKLPEWILDARPVLLGNRGAVATVEASGRVAVWDADLRVVWEASTGARSQGGVVLARLRPQWRPAKKSAKGASEEMLESLNAEAEGLQSFFLTADSRGFVYKISTQDLSK